MPELTVVVPTIGMYPVLSRVLDGFAEQNGTPGDFEVVVVADRSEPDPGSVEAAIGRRPYPVRLIAGDVPGVSANRNAGCLASSSPLVLFNDNDAIPVPGLVSEHLEWHRRHPEDEVGVVGLVRWAPELAVTPFMRWLDQGIQFDYPNIDGIEAGWGRFYTANASVKRSFFHRVGGFDQFRLPYGYEDLDWAYRASGLGFRLLFNDRAIVDHLRPMTLDFWQKRARRIAVAERQFVALHPEVPPYLWGLFSDAVRHPPARGRGLKLASVVAPGTPWLGAKVWSSVDLYYRQQIAPHFLEAWEAWEDRRGLVDLSERADL